VQDPFDHLAWLHHNLAKHHSTGRHFICRLEAKFADVRFDSGNQIDLAVTPEVIRATVTQHSGQQQFGIGCQLLDDV
jgi:hypothetical protein